MSPNKTVKDRRVSRGYEKIINAQLHPQLQIFQQSKQSQKFQNNIKNLYHNHRTFLKQLNNYIPIPYNHHQRHNSATEFKNQNQLFKLKTIKRVIQIFFITINYKFFIFYFLGSIINA